MKDLIRFLRHEDETRDVRQQLGAAQILQNDLLPLLVQHASDAQLFDAVVRCPPSPPSMHRGWDCPTPPTPHILVESNPAAQVEILAVPPLCSGYGAWMPGSHLCWERRFGPWQSPAPSPPRDLWLHDLCPPRLVVNLTQPALLCFGKVPKDPGERHHFLQVTSHLQAYKEVSPTG